MKYIIPILFILLTIQIKGNSFQTEKKRVNLSKPSEYILADDTIQLNCLLTLIDSLKEKDYDKSIQLCKQAIELAQKTEQKEKEVDAIIYKAIVKTGQGNYTEAKDALKIALNYSKVIQYSNGIIKSLNEYGNLNYYQSNYDLATDYYFQAIKIAEKNKNYSSTLKLHNNIAIIFSILEKDAEALEHFHKALDISKINKDTINIISTWVNLARFYNIKEDYDTSIFYLRNAIRIYKIKNDTRGLSASLNNLGVALLKTNKPGMAEAAFLEGLQIAEKNNYIPGIISSLISTGRFFYGINQPEKSVPYFEKGIKICLQTNDKESLQQLYNSLFRAYYDMGDYKTALENKRISLEYKDSVFNEQMEKYIASLQTKYETEKKEEQIKYLQLKTKTQKKIWFLSVGGFLVIMASLSYLFYSRQLHFKQKNLLLEREKKMQELDLAKTQAESNYKQSENLRLQEEMKAAEEINLLKQEKLNEIINHKDRELATNTLHINNKNEILAEIKITIEKSIKSTKKESSETLKKLVKDIEENIDIDNEWNKFKLHFEKVHQDFFKRLSEIAPDITQHELRMCAYFRIGMDTKEVAKILSLSASAIEKRRYRLRKKLNMNPEDNLYEFLCSI